MNDALPWARESLELLEGKANSDSLALLGPVASSPARRSVTFGEIRELTGTSPNQAHGRLAGLAMIRKRRTR